MKFFQGIAFILTGVIVAHNSKNVLLRFWNEFWSWMDNKHWSAGYDLSTLGNDILLGAALIALALFFKDVRN